MDPSRAPPSQLVDLMDLLRVATVECVEAIAKWRSAKQRDGPFTWNSMNYLLKIASDLDFLDTLDSLREWCGFDLVRNPFLVPLGLNAPTDAVMPMSETGFTELGGSSTRRSQLQGTDIFGDMLGGWEEAGNNSREADFGPGGSSIVGDMDMLRVRAAVKVILQEECIHGRYTLESNGQLVPADVAARDLFSAALEVDDRSHLHNPARAPPVLAPFADDAGVGRDPSSYHVTPAKFTRKGSAGKKAFRGDGHGKRLPGKMRAKCSGGELGELAGASTAGRRRRPFKRTVGATLDIEVVRRKRQNQALQDKLGEMQRELAEAEAELAAVEAGMQSSLMSPEQVSASNLAAAKIQALSRGRSGREAAHDARVRRSRLMAQQRELAKKREQLEHERQKLEAIEEQRLIYKKQQKEAQEQREALTLERKRRLLEHDHEALLVEDDAVETLEDDAATAIQRIIRGAQAREYVRRLLPILHGAATRIQALGRGVQGRVKAHVVYVQKNAVLTIQRIWRGKAGRELFQRSLGDYLQHKNARQVQRVWRGRCGRRRVQQKRAFLNGARRAAESVSTKQLFRQDVIDLGDAVEAPFIDGTEPPPAGIVLNLLQVVMLMLVGDGKPDDIVTSFTALGVRNVSELGPGYQLTWKDSLRVLRRGSKLIRMLRQLAEGPSSSPPRVLHMSQAAVKAYQAIRHDLSWNEEALGKVGRGGKACQQLHVWVDSMQDVFQCQYEFLSEMGGPQPAWLKRMRGNMMQLRHLSLEVVILEKAAHVCDKMHREAVEGSKDVHGVRKGDLLVEVARKVRDLEHARLSECKQALETLREVEVEAQKGDAAADLLEVQKLTRRLQESEEALREAKMAFANAKDRAKGGGVLEEAQLPELLSNMTDAKVKRREAWSKLELTQVKIERNGARRGIEVKINGDLRAQAIAIGELEASLCVSEETLNHFFALHDMPVQQSVPKGALSKGELSELSDLQGKVQGSKARVESARQKLSVAEEELEARRERLEEEERQREENASPRLWEDPTVEEFEEDLREDAVCAKEEAELARQFIPLSMQRSTSERPRPLIICFSRDIPGQAKSQMKSCLMEDLPGMFVSLDEDRRMGLPVTKLQGALSSGYSVICDVDMGICSATRAEFVHAVNIAKATLIPAPSMLLVTGSPENRVGNGTEMHLGCTERDLKLQKDGEMKRYLQTAAQALLEMANPRVISDLAAMAAQELPPSASHILVMEAIIILLTPEQTFDYPNTVDGVTWGEACNLLKSPEKLVSSLQAFDKFAIPPVNLVVLQAYMTNTHWPQVGDMADKESEHQSAFAVLLRWAVAVIRFAGLLRNGGDWPGDITRALPEPGLFLAVIPLLDGDSAVAELDPNTKKGWRAAYTQLLGPVLEDVRVHREAKVVPGSSKASQVPHIVQVYQDAGHVFFHVYDPQSSVSHFVRMSELRISYLLAPVKSESFEFGPRSLPADRRELFARLVALLKFQRLSHKEGHREGLTCERKLRLLVRRTLKISGHDVALTAYEVALGELRMHAYLPKLSAAAELKVDDQLLSEVLPNASTRYGERCDLESQDCDRLLGPVTDRLGLSPSYTTYVTTSAGQSPSAPASTRSGSKHFRMSVRRAGGPGFALFSTVASISGAKHIVTARELSAGGWLRVSAYNQSNSINCDVYLSATERKCLLGLKTDAWLLWKGTLLRRLSLRRARDELSKGGEVEKQMHRERVLFVDKSIYSAVVKVPEARRVKRALRLKALLSDGGASLSLHASEGSSCNECCLRLAVTDLVNAVGWPEVEVGEVAEAEAMVKMLGSMATRARTLEAVIGRLSFSRDDNALVYEGGGKVVKEVMEVRASAVLRRPQPRLEAANRAEEGGAGLTKVGTQAAVVMYSHDIGEDEVGVQFWPADPTRGQKEKKGRFSLFSGGKSKDKDKKEKDKDKKEGKKKSEAGSPKAAVEEITEEESDVPEEMPELEEEPYTGGAPSMALALPGEMLVFKEALRVHVTLVEATHAQVNVVVSVFKSTEGEEGEEGQKSLHLRVVVFNPKLSSYAEARIAGKSDLREVIGPLRQELLVSEDKEGVDWREMFRHIGHERIVLQEGLWSEELDSYVPSGADFTVKLLRSRIYKSIKQTPVHLGGDRDAEFNRSKLIEEPDDAHRRGIKIYRRALKMNGRLFQVTAFELRPRVGEPEAAVPTLKFIAYEPKSQLQVVAVAEAVAVLELAGGEHSPWLAAGKRESLANIVAKSLRVHFGSKGEATLVVVWSGTSVGFVEEIYEGKHVRPQQEKPILRAKRADCTKVCSFSARVASLEVVVSVFAQAAAAAAHAAAAALTFNLYSPKLSEGADVEVSEKEQIVMLGRSVMSYEGEARESAMRRIVRFITISQSDDKQRPGRVEMTARIAYVEQQPWLQAYLQLDPSEKAKDPSERPTGQPLIFIPSNNQGDPLLHLGVSISGLQVILSVFTKNTGMEPSRGLIFEAYTQDTCLTQTLHVGAQELLEQVSHRQHLLQPDQALSTIKSLIKRLLLKKSSAGRWELVLDPAARVSE
ncbi:unnamed protein product [Chrysoparadoxa australica]